MIYSKDYLTKKLIDMNEQEAKYRQFDVMKRIALRRLNKKLIYSGTSYLEREIQGKNLQDAEVLLRMVLKLINEHNSGIRADIARVENLQFRDSSRDFKTKYFIGISSEKVMIAVKEYKGDDYYKVADLFEPSI